LTIEATVLPDDTSWSCEKMPEIMSTSAASKNFGFDCSIGIDIKVNHTTIRGLKFIGNTNPDVSYYYAIGRSGKNLKDLEVTQCVFVGDSNKMPIQSGILAHGNQIKVTHCIFYNCKNSVVYYFANENKNIERYGSEMSNCIIYGAYESGIWTASPDKNFIFRQNIITNCKYAWVHNIDNKTKYTLEDCVITNNENYITSLDGEKWEFSQSNIIYSVKTVNGLVVPRDYLNVLKIKWGAN
ncbi:right-handed parallel beta-helix repeat-containing protein, partial [Candidatus Neomarinimicrobiota bacterium]